ncbi:hypothetical protein [uncultured Campylobacter sp.]|uniref:hypothetical protein n=1 Tax=uncultured Campylobacter sp. TaxID=218934 RepID=UPI0026239C2F|nr:hypothetical protein [uncultured Campylobacter sp.]
MQFNPNARPNLSLWRKKAVNLSRIKQNLPATEKPQNELKFTLKTAQIWLVKFTQKLNLQPLFDDL